VLSDKCNALLFVDDLLDVLVVVVELLVEQILFLYFFEHFCVPLFVGVHHDELLYHGVHGCRLADALYLFPASRTVLLAHYPVGEAAATEVVHTRHH